MDLTATSNVIHCYVVLGNLTYKQFLNMSVALVIDPRNQNGIEQIKNLGFSYSLKISSFVTESSSKWSVAALFLFKRFSVFLNIARRSCCYTSLYSSNNHRFSAPQGMRPNLNRCLISAEVSALTREKFVSLLISWRRLLTPVVAFFVPIMI